MDAKLLYDELKGLVKFLAVRFGANGHYALDPDELEAEGFMVFARVLQKDKTGDPDLFKKVFKTSLVNHYKTLLSTHRYTQKRGFDQIGDGETLTDIYIDLSDIEEILGYSAFDEVYFKEYVEAVRQLLVGFPEAAVLFEVCIDPPKEVEDMAVHESRRKAYLARVHGKMVRNAEIVRIRQKHIALFLGWSLSKVTQHIQILREMVDQVIYA
jgi:hypothetical protein